MPSWRLTKFSYYLDFLIYPPLIVALVLLKYEVSGLSLAWVQWLVAGLIAWTLIEYWLHRIIFHGALKTIAKMHMLHHATPDDFIGVPVWYSIVIFLVLGLPVLGLLGLERGSGTIVGLLVGYTLYIGIHDAVHHRSSYLHPWFSRLGVNHLPHHYHNGRADFGVTTDVWDRLFGTKR